jgi:hypothetical protein
MQLNERTITVIAGFEFPAKRGLLGQGRKLWTLVFGALATSALAFSFFCLPATPAFAGITSHAAPNPGGSSELISCSLETALSKVLTPNGVYLTSPTCQDDIRVMPGVNYASYLKKPTDGSIEIVEERTETSKTFVNPDDTLTWVGATGPVHYRDNYADAKEPWKEIDTRVYTETADFRLYDHMPIRVKIFKNKTGYEIESKRTGEKYIVRLDEVAGQKVSKFENTADADIEFEIKSTAVRLWKNLKTAFAPREFKWKVTRIGHGNGLQFRENPEAFVMSDGKPVRILITKTDLDPDSFTWNETSPQSQCKVDTDVNATISAGDDDCWEDPTTPDFSLTSTTITMGYWNDCDTLDASVYGGFRFLNITVPSGSTISAASITLTKQSSQGNPRGLIQGIAEDNTATWSAGSKPTSRTKTGAGVQWVPMTAGGTSPDIKTVVKEIVDRAGWASGNAMGFVIYGYYYTPHGCTFNEYLYAWAYEHGSNFPALAITYTAPQTPTTIRGAHIGGGAMIR